MLLFTTSICGQDTLYQSVPVFAVKSNLLFDVATVVNAGIEVPVGRHWSISADGYFPWWRLRKNDFTLQGIAGTAECKYWFGNRTRRKRLTGWFAGVYAGAGYFDFQCFSKDGVQGEMFIMGGISFGFAHTIAKHLSLEYSIGGGYLRTDYRKYHMVDNPDFGYIKVHPYPWEERRFTGIMPTKVGVTLVWTLDKKKGGER